MKFATRNIFNNRKTRWSVDFGICELMSLNPNGNLTSEKCPGCYSARLLNIYKDTKAKLESLNDNYPDMESFKSDISKIAATGHRFIRFYSLGDYTSSKEIKYIHAAADIMPVELFSKTLHMYHKKDIAKIASHPNVHISLSFNKNYSPKYIEDIWTFLKNNQLLKNVQLNYTFIADEKMENIPYISVYHTTKNNKLDLFEKMGYNRVCCGRDDEGKRITEKNSGNSHGSCAKCPLCKLPAANKSGEILVPNKLKELYSNG